MVFYIDKSIHTALASRKITEPEVDFFDSLARACRRGYCALCGNHSSLSDLSEHLPGRSGEYYRVALNRYAEQGVILSAVEKVFVLTFSPDSLEDTLPTVLKSSPNKICVISIINALKWSFDGFCYLLAENLNDCKFYHLIAKYYCASHSIQGVDIHLRFMSGGGNTINDELRNCVCNHMTPTLCIVDSDWKHGPSKAFPNKPQDGKTLQRVSETSQQLARDTTLPPHYLYPLPIHEVENLIPLHTMNHLSQEFISMREGVTLLKELKGIKAGEPLLYYDFKNGFPYIKDGPQRAYWQDIYVDFLNGTAENMPPLSKDTNGPTPFPAAGIKSLLERAITVISEDIESIQIDEHLLPYWEQLGSLVFTWGCSNLPLLA